MNAMVFDTLKLAKRLEEAGFTTAQAQGAAAAIAGTFHEDLATRQDLTISETAIRRDLTISETAIRRDLKESETALRRDLKESETALRRDQQESETALRTEIQTLRTEFRSDLRDLEHRMTIRLGTMLAGGIVLVGAMVKLL
jgi:hypothetical protein